MSKKIFSLIILFILTCTLYPQGIQNTKFVITAMDNGADQSYTYMSTRTFNTWHKYTGPLDGWPSVPNDRFDSDPVNYGPFVNTQINNNLNNYGFRTVMDRPKIEYLALGQLSEYQAEQTHLDDDYWFYTYSSSMTQPPFITDGVDNSQWGGQNVKVKHCIPDPNQTDGGSGWILSGLRANREQANKIYWYWQNDAYYAWYVMPKIRIPVGVPDNTPVCRIDILDWDGNPVPEYTNGIIIYAKHFRRNITAPYQGDYLQEYFFVEGDDPTPITIPAGQICPGPARNFPDWTNVSIETDFKVFWYGQCEMWIDYVKVENEPAYKLFKEPQWTVDIQSETDLALNNYDPVNPVPNYFYIEEFEFNHLPCIKKVNEIIRARSGEKLGLIPNLNEDLFKIHRSDLWTYNYTAEKLKKVFVEYAGVKGMVSVAYCLEGWDGTENLDYPLNLSNRKGINPYTLPVYSTYNGDYNADMGILAWKNHPPSMMTGFRTGLKISGVLQITSHIC